MSSSTTSISTTTTTNDKGNENHTTEDLANKDTTQLVQQPPQPVAPRPFTKRTKKEESPHRYQSGMRPSIVTTINNTNPNNNNPNTLIRAKQQRTNEPYESYIEDSFVGHWEHEDDEDEYQEDFDSESHDGGFGEEHSDLHHPSTIEFDFESFGPESIIYSPPATNNINSTNSSIESSVRSATTSSTNATRPPPLLEVSAEAEKADETTTNETTSNPEPTSQRLSDLRDELSTQPTIDTTSNNSPSPQRHPQSQSPRVLNINYPTQEYLVDPAQIDLKVIEPYKKVISHAGYCNHFDPSVPGEPTPPGQQPPAIIVFSACYLPDRSRRDYNYVMDHLFLYVLTSLHELIADDYILIYLHNTQPPNPSSSTTSTATSAGGSSTSGGSATSSTPTDGQTPNNLPTFTWMKRCYQMIDRRLRKNLRILYLVKPTFWLKTIVIMCKPFISAKFSKKLRFVEDMNALRKCMPVDKLILPASAENL